MWKRIKKTFHHLLIKKNIRPREVFFLWSNIWHPVWPTISSHFHPILAKDLHVMFSESAGQPGRTVTWLWDVICLVLSSEDTERVLQVICQILINLQSPPGLIFCEIDRIIICWAGIAGTTARRWAGGVTNNNTTNSAVVVLVAWHAVTRVCTCGVVECGMYTDSVICSYLWST